MKRLVTLTDILDGMLCWNAEVTELIYW